MEKPAVKGGDWDGASRGAMAGTLGWGYQLMIHLELTCGLVFIATETSWVFDSS
jgi:hypothetical protein